MLSRMPSCVVLCLALVLFACAGSVPSTQTAYEPNDTPSVSTPEPTPVKVLDPPSIPTAAPATLKELAAFPVFTDPGRLPTLAVVETDSSKTASVRTKLPLKETRVVARLSQFVAEVEVTQRYENDQKIPIEAVYVFPLPENAAVHNMKMMVGDRTIEARIDERERARRTYDKAKSLGFTAALLEQERPNVFTQSVANIEPGKAIEVSVRYVQDLSYDAGVHEFVFPMVVGPRFVQGKAIEGAPSGTGTKADTDMVPDASRVTPPYAGAGERTGHDISIEVITDPSLYVGKYKAITHDVVESTDDEGGLHLKLAAKDKIPNRDFVLRYRVSGEQPRATMLMSGEEGGYFSLVVDPPNLDIDELVGKREIVFVVDISGSMAGVPLALCKRAMRLALGKVRPFDTFNVITFAGRTEKLFSAASPANEENIRQAVDFVERMRSGGGTMMLDAVAEALSPDVEAGRDRYVFFLTDGFVSVEDQIMSSTRSFVAQMADKGRRAKVFGFGVGSAPNRALLEGLSREGKGVAVYATNREDPDRGVNQFFRYIDKSVLRDVSIDWGGGKVSDVTPGEIPDLFASHPLILHGKLANRPSRKPVLHATTAIGAIDIPIEIAPPKKSQRREALGVLWARSKIAWLETDLASGDDNARKEITRLGLEFGLVTKFTSFIAVDRSARISDGDPARVVQPNERPEDVDLPAAGGDGLRAKPQAMDMPPGMAPPAPPTLEQRGSKGGDMQADAPPSESPMRGCGCVLAEHRDTPIFGIGLSLAACAIATLRRRGRRNPPRPVV